MFNRSVYFGGDTQVKVNAVSGGIVKNHKDSYFLTFHLNSEMAKWLLSSRPHMMVRKNGGYNTTEKYVEVLQMVVAGDMQVIAGVIDLPDGKDGKDS